jgi:ferredoxin
VSCGACVQACPTATLTEKSVIELGQPDAQRDTTCAYCGVGCSFKAEMQGTATSRAHGAVEGRRRQRGPLVRQGPLRLGLRHPQGPHHQPMIREKITDEWQRGLVGGGDRPTHRDRFKRIQAKHGAIGRRHHLVALHQRRGLRRPEDGARRLRQQQRRHLRARVPLAHRLRPGTDVRHLGRHAGLRLGRAGRRDAGHRRQPHRRPPGVRARA